MMQDKLCFLPGASGDADFWKPVADALGPAHAHVRYGWPGFGKNPADPAVHGLDDLAQTVCADIDGPTTLIAQSMGGIIAIKVALARPESVSRVVLTATSGGVDLNGIDVLDWREEFATANPGFPRWFIDTRENLTARLKEIRIPVLLLWGDADPISPVAVGKRLAAHLPHAELRVIAGGGHDLGHRHADAVAPLIRAFLKHA